MGLSACHGLQHMKRRERNGWMPFCVSGGLGMGSGVERERGRRPLAFGSLHGRTATNITSIRRAAVRAAFLFILLPQPARSQPRPWWPSVSLSLRPLPRATPYSSSVMEMRWMRKAEGRKGPLPLLLSSAEVSSSSLSHPIRFFLHFHSLFFPFLFPTRSAQIRLVPSD